MVTRRIWWAILACRGRWQSTTRTISFDEGLIAVRAYVSHPAVYSGAGRGDPARWDNLALLVVASAGFSRAAHAPAVGHRRGAVDAGRHGAVRDRCLSRLLADQA